MSAMLNKIADDLRRRAEALVAGSTEAIESDELKDIKELAHELAVHQAELEIQNEELLEAQLALQDTKDKFAALFDQAPVGYVVLDASGIIRRVNTTWRAMINCENEDLRGMPFVDYLVPEDTPLFLARFRAFFRNPSRKQITVRMKRKGFAPLHARIEASPGVLRAEASTSFGASIEELMVTISDISDLYEAQQKVEQQNQELRQSETALAESLQTAKYQAKELQLLLEGSRAILEGGDFGQMARRIFDAACEMTGAVSGYVALLSSDGAENDLAFLESGGLPCSVDENLPMPVRGLRAEAYQSQKAVFDNDFMNSAWVDFMPEGHVELRNVMFAPLNIEGKTVGVMGLANKPEDFTEDDLNIACVFGQLAAIALKNSRALEAVTESETKYRRLFELESDAIFVIDDETEQIIEANFAATILYGYKREELLSLRITDLSAEPDQTRKALTEGLDRVPVRWHKNHKGTIFPVEITANHFDDINGRPTHIETIRDISFRLEAEKSIRASEAEKKAILDGISANIILLDKDLRIVWMNKTAASFINQTHDEMIGKPCHIYWGDPETPCTNCPSVKAFQTKKSEHLIMETSDSRVWDKRGEPIFDKDGNVEFVVEIAQDITDQIRANEEKERLQDHLQHARRMETVGTLAGGIAHEFNNMLQSILGHAQLLLLEKGPADSDTPSLNTIRNTGERAAQLVKQMLEFSMKARSELKHIQLEYSVNQAKTILERTIPRNIEIEVQSVVNSSTVLADPIQIEQMLLDLGTNAVDAMPNGGKLLFKIQNKNLDDKFIKQHAGSYPGRYVILSVSDTGHGMDEKTLEKIFDPFFTTKKIGHGTGLGLASVYGIVKGQKGFISCKSTVGQGTTINIHLPVVEQSDTGVILKSGTPSFPRGRENILLVDDEDAIRDFAKQALTKFGYTVMTASSGENALELYSGNPHEIDLVILDLNMPGMGGHKCLQELFRINPCARIILASGNSLQGQIKNYMEAGVTKCLEKPYELNELANSVREALDNGE